MFSFFYKKYPSDLALLTENHIPHILKDKGPKKGGDILREAANLGNMPSQCFLSILYLKNLDKAMADNDEQLIAFLEGNAEHFTTLAAKQNDSNSQYNLAKFYLTKGGNIMRAADNYYTKESKEYFRKAEYWYKAAAKQGHSNAIKSLNELSEIFEISNK